MAKRQSGKGKSRRKNPKIGGVAPKPSKTPRTIAEVDYRSQNPAWQIAHVEWESPWGWAEIDATTTRKVADRLSSFESMTWNEILGKQNHGIRTDRLSPDAQRRLSELSLDDVERLYSLRVTGTERVWGILDQNVLRVLWWDPSHDVYPVNRTGN